LPESGPNGFFYQQITGDSGSGAKLGSFKGQTAGGPGALLRAQGREATLAAELKWLPELVVENRLKGDWIWFKLGLIFLSRKTTQFP